VDPDGLQATITIRGRTDFPAGHAWIIIDWGNKKVEKLEIQPHFFERGWPSDVVVNKDVHRPFHAKRTVPLDTRKHPDLDAVRKSNPNDDWNAVTNNCTDYAVDEWEAVTGENISGGGIGTPAGLVKDIGRKNKRKPTGLKGPRPPTKEWNETKANRFPPRLRPGKTVHDLNLRSACRGYAFGEALAHEWRDRAKPSERS
jgi:hypothetical protein